PARPGDHLPEGDVQIPERTVFPGGRAGGGPAPLPGGRTDPRSAGGLWPALRARVPAVSAGGVSVSGGRLRIERGDAVSGAAVRPVRPPDGPGERTGRGGHARRELAVLCRSRGRLERPEDEGALLGTLRERR